MVLPLHVDEVNDNHAAQIAQTQLTGNGTCSFQIGLENGFVETFGTDKATGIHIHRGHGFGLVNDQVATRFQIDSTP